MSKFFTKIQKWWYFHLQNPVIRRGEEGAFKWEFRRFWLSIETLSGNFKVRFIASEHPYAYLLSGEDSQTYGFAQRLYMMGSMLTTDQKFVNDIDKAFANYQKRLEKVKPDENEFEQADLEFEKGVQEYVEMPKKERKKYERGVDGRFKKAVKNGVEQK